MSHYIMMAMLHYQYRRFGPLAIAALLGATALAPAQAGQEVLAGPVSARIQRVIDGDTLRVRTRIWLGMDMEVDI